MATGQKLEDGGSIYGPPMSPAIFRYKWLAKFRDTYYEMTDNLASCYDDPIETAGVAAKQVAHVAHFFFEALALSVDWDDFPQEPSVDVDGRRQVKLRDAVAYLNPFQAAQRVAFMTDYLLERLQTMKHGQRIGNIRWKHLPLEVRRQVNDLLEVRTKLEENGVWPVDKEVREFAQRGFKMED